MDNMETAADSISVRISRMNQQLFSPYIQGGTCINSKFNVEGLQDALLALYDECNSKSLKNIPDVVKFLEKFETTVKDLKKMRVKPSDFEVKTIIGRGNFGEVSLVKERVTGHIYAMKCLPKHCSQAQKEASSFEAERDILALAARPGASEWLTALQYAFQDSAKLYLVMEYLPGGDLSSLLDRFDGDLPEDFVKFYLAEVVQAVHSLHQLGYVHRDVKPDNVLLDRCGHIKLADFGSAAKLSPEGKVSSPLPVGTPEYIAPEVLQSVSGENVSYGVECDYWAVGVLAYELIFHDTPFQGAETTHIYSNIMAHEGGDGLEFPPDAEISYHLKNMITGLLEPAATRLTYHQVKKHKFFSGISWETLRDSVPPYVPVVRGECDTSNFLEPVDDMEFSKINPFNFQSKVLGFSGHQLPFVGFTLTPSVVATKPLYAKQAEDQTYVKEIPNKPSDHPDIIRSREIKVLREMLKEREARLDESIKERRETEIKLDQMTAKATKYKQVCEQDRQEFKAIETKTITKVKEMRAQQEDRITALTIEIQDCKAECRKEKARAAEFEGRLKVREEQVNAERQNSDRLQALLQKRKDNMTKARRETLTSMGDAQQIAELRMKLGIEESEKRNLQEKSQLLTQQVNELQGEIRKLCEEVDKSADAVDKSELLMIAAQERLKKLEVKYEQEKHDHEETKAELDRLEMEHADSVALLEQTREDAAREDRTLEASLMSLQAKLEETEAEKQALKLKLEDAQHNDEEQQLKVSSLEQYLNTFEERMRKLEEENDKLQTAEKSANTLSRKSVVQTPAEVSVLQAQLERLEAQLEKAREASVLDKQAARTAQTDLYKKEKELSDARIDIRIANRELKTVEEEAANLRTEKETLTNNLAESDSKVNELTAQLTVCKNELEAAKSLIKKLEKQLETLRDREDESQTRFVEQTRHLSSVEARASEKAELASKLQSNLDKLKRELEATQTQSHTSSSEINHLKAQVESLLMNNEALKDACTMFDEQLVDSEKLRSVYEERLAHAEQERARLQNELEQAQGNLRAKTAEADEMRALRGAAEERLVQANSNAKFQASESLEEVKDLRQQLTEARHQAEQLLAQVNELEQALCDSDRVTREQNRVVEALKAKCTDLQEEIAVTLTDLQAARDASESLSVKLEVARRDEQVTAQKLTDAESKAAEEQAERDQNIVKLKATIEQQKKLIEFLQVKPVLKKKKTLANVLFGARPKENIAPSPLIPAGQVRTPMSAQSIKAAKEKSKTWEPRTAERMIANGSAGITKNAQQTPLTSKVTSMTKKVDEPLKQPVKPEEKKMDTKPEVTSSPLAPMILDQTVLPEYYRLAINCAVTLAGQVTVLGADEGLYSLHPTPKGAQLVQIAGVNKVKQIVAAPHIGLALFVSGSTPILKQCELRSLTVAAEAAHCSKPNVTLLPVKDSPDDCHICAVSAALPCKNKEGSTSTFLCVANRTHASIMRWNVGSNSFESLRLLSTTRPIVNMLFTPHSLLLVCDEVIEIDLQDFSVEDFLDQADKSLALAKAALKSRSPGEKAALFDVTKPGAKAVPEFLLCLPEFAVFLDNFGHRSRPNDLKWTHRPQAFWYQSPLLYVQHETGVLCVDPSDSKLCTQDDSCSSRNSACSTNQDTALLSLSSPKILGAGSRHGSIVASAHKDTGTAILTLVGPGVDDVSLDNDLESGRDEFSFTSSLENSLEGDAGDAVKKVQFQ